MIDFLTKQSWKTIFATHQNKLKRIKLIHTEKQFKFAWQQSDIYLIKAPLFSGSNRKSATTAVK